MRKRKNNTITKLIPLLFIPFVVFIFFGMLTAPTRGIISIGSITPVRPLVHGNRLFVGSEDGNLSAINRWTGKEAWSVRLTEAVGSNIRHDRGSLYVTTADGVLYALDAKTGKERWRHHATEGYVFETEPIIHSNLLYIGDSNGVLHAVNIKSGKQSWAISQAPVKVNQLDRSNRPNWFGHILFYNGKIVVGGVDGTIYSIVPSTGRVEWKYAAGSTLSAVEANSGLIVGVTKDGKIIGISTNGIERWSASGDKWVPYLLYMKREHPLTFIGQRLPPFLIQDWFARRYLSVLFVTSDGDIISRDIRTGKTFYTSSLGDRITAFPTIWSQFLFLAADKKIIKFDAKIGKITWEYVTKETVSSRPVIAYRNSFTRPLCQRWGQIYWVSRFCLVTVFIGDHDGNFEAVRANSGNPIWQFRASGPITSPPIIGGRRLYLETLDGTIYNMDLFGGKLPKSVTRRRLRMTQNVSSVSKNDILEITFLYEDDAYPHPWKDIAVNAEFTSASGDTIAVNGYYYDKNTWKVKFNPPHEGEWTYKTHFYLPDDVLEKNGKFVSNTTTKTSYLHIYEQEGTKQLSEDGASVFSMVGIGDVIDDANCNGNLLDDFFVGDGETNPEFDIFNKRCKGNTTFDDGSYLSRYGMFNTFRWSVNNASFNLWKYTDPAQTRYQVFEGKLGDRLAQSVVNQNMKLWMTLYSWDLPILNTSPAYIHMIKGYIRYVIARYGAYVSVWEINNEAHTPAEITDQLALYIKSLDYEARPVTTSWEQPQLSSIDMSSVHWYANEPLGASDTQLLGQTKKLEQYGKPIVFSEQGNKDANWDTYSAVRMRVRMWTAALHRIGIIFWNTSHRKDYDPPEYKNGNQFIGEEERLYVQTLTKFMKDVDMEAQSIHFDTVSTVRSYGLESPRAVFGYFHRFSNYSIIAPLRVSMFVPRSGKMQWINTKTGEIISELFVSKGRQTFISPAFQIDIAVKITF